MRRWLQALQYEQDVLSNEYSHLDDHVTWGVYWAIHATINSTRSL